MVWLHACSTLGADLVKGVNAGRSESTARGPGAKAAALLAIAAASAGCNTPPSPSAPVTLTGYQVVSNTLTINPTRTASQSAPCPPGKVALSAGFSAAAVATQGVNAAEVERGLEVKKARPVWPAAGLSYAEVELRNAHVSQPALLTVTAVCVNRHPDLRLAEAVNGVTNASIANPRGRHPLGCAAGEVVVGGGAAVPQPGHLKINAPRADGQAWDAEALQAGVANTLTMTTTVVCAPASLVRGRQIATSGPTALAALGYTPQNISCPGRSKVLAAGVGDSTVVTGIDMIPVQLEIGGARGSAAGRVDSLIHNRNTFGATNSVVVETSALCAEVD